MTFWIVGRTRKKGWERCKRTDTWMYMCKYVYSQIWSFLTWERLRIVAEQEEEEEEDEGGAEQRQCANKAWIPVIWDFHSFDFRFEIAPVITCDWSTPFWKGIRHRTYNLHCPWERILKKHYFFSALPKLPLSPARHLGDIFTFKKCQNQFGQWPKDMMF